ncbi:MAG: M16 family metallopeptidase, partial [Hyphomicrobiaceae bacterium]
MTVRISTLENGLRIVTEAMPHLETVSLGVWVGTGSRFEGAEENGISHLLEHMAFKGTGRRSAREIAETIENVGGDINAATSLETTAYYARVMKDDAPLAIDVLADILQNSTFEADELAREKDVILQEIAANLDNPEEVVFDTAQEIAFPDQPTGRSILGTPETLAGFDQDSLQSYLARQYVPSRMVLSAAGAVDHDAIAAQAGELFSSPANESAKSSVPADFAGGRRAVVRPIEQTHVVFAFEGPALGSADYYTAQVFSGLFGGGMSSRLFQKVREERGLCYSVYAYCWGMVDTGFFGIYAGTSADLVAEMRDVVFAELRDVAVNGPAEGELAKAKAQMKSGLLMGLESSSVRAEQMARHLLTYGRI